MKSLDKKELFLYYFILFSVMLLHRSKSTEYNWFYYSRSSIDCLPDELLLQVFSYLSAIDLCSCGLVSKRWSRLYRDEQLWGRLCKLERLDLESVILPNSSVSSCHNTGSRKIRRTLSKSSFTFPTFSNFFELYFHMKKEDILRKQKMAERRSLLIKRKQIAAVLQHSPKFGDFFTAKVSCSLK